MRLIDADALNYTNVLAPCGNGKYEDVNIVCETDIDAMPTIDAVPVVRCKACKHRDKESGLCAGRGWPMQLVADDGFCEKGKRDEGTDEHI